MINVTSKDSAWRITGPGPRDGDLAVCVAVESEEKQEIYTFAQIATEGSSKATLWVGSLVVDSW